MAVSYSSNRITVSGSKDSGVSTNGSTSSVTDSSKSWAADEYAGRYVWIRSGTEAGQSRMIKSNTSTKLTIEDDHNFTSSIAAGAQYRISYNYQDIYDAEIAGSWGIVVKSNELTFGFEVALRINSGGFLGAEQSASISIKHIPSCSFQIVSGSRYCQGRLRNDFGFGGGSLRLNGGLAGKGTHIITTGGGGPQPGDIFLQGCCVDTDCFFNLYNSSSTPTNYWDIRDCLFGKLGGRFQKGNSGQVLRVRALGNSMELLDTLINVISPEPVMKEIEVSNSTYGAYCYAPFGGFTLTDFYWHDVQYLLRARLEKENTYVNFVDADPRSDFNAPVYYEKANDDKAVKVRFYTSWYPYTQVDGVYETGAAYRAVNNINEETVLSTTDSNLLLTEILWREIVYNNSITNYGVFEVVIAKYGYVSQRLTRGFNVVTSYVDNSAAVKKGELVNLVSDPSLIANESTAGSYASKININGSTRIITVSDVTNSQELYDYYAYWSNQETSLQYIQLSDILSSSAPSSFLNINGTLEINQVITNGINVLGDMRITSVFDFDNHNVSGVLTFTSPGTYSVSNSTINEVINASGGAVTLTLDSVSSVTINTGPNITIAVPSTQLTVSVNQTGCDVVILAAGTKTVLASVDAQDGTNFVYTFSGTFDIDIGVIKQGFIVNYTYAFSLTGSSTTLPITLLPSRDYV